MCLLSRNVYTSITSGWILVIMVLLLEFGPSGGHEIINFLVPPIADPRENVNLVCHYNMKLDHLYSAKWLKDDQEVFRYMPGQEPAGLSFPVSGVHLVREPKCSPIACDLELTDLKPSSAGAYRCEVSTEGPTFSIVQQTSNMTVAALPQRNPLIEGLASPYTLGQVIRLNCTSSPSMPPTELKWYINDREASFLDVEGPWESLPDSRGLSTQTLSLRLRAQRSLFLDNGRDGGTMRIQCISELPPHLPVDQHRRETTMTASLLPPPNLTNEKLHWPGSGSSSVNIFECVTLSIIFPLFVLLKAVRIDLIRIWRRCNANARA